MSPRATRTLCQRRSAAEAAPALWELPGEARWGPSTASGPQKPFQCSLSRPSPRPLPGPSLPPALCAVARPPLPLPSSCTCLLPSFLPASSFLSVETQAQCHLLQLVEAAPGPVSQHDLCWHAGVSRCPASLRGAGRGQAWAPLQPRPGARPGACRRLLTGVDHP